MTRALSRALVLVIAMVVACGGSSGDGKTHCTPNLDDNYAGCDVLDCAGAASCDAVCAGNMSCPQLDCEGAEQCRLDCTADAVCHDVDCKGASDCFVDCSNGLDGQPDNGSVCEVDCTDAASCAVNCDAAGQCLVNCTGAGSGSGSCGFDICQGGSSGMQSCGNGVIVCNRACP